MKKYAVPIALFAAFEAVAITLWLTKGNPFYLFNFTYIGASVALGAALFIQGNKNARRVTQLLVARRRGAAPSRPRATGRCVQPR